MKGCTHDVQAVAAAINGTWLPCLNTPLYAPAWQESTLANQAKLEAGQAATLAQLAEAQVCRPAQPCLPAQVANVVAAMHSRLLSRQWMSCEQSSVPSCRPLWAASSNWWRDVPLSWRQLLVSRQVELVKPSRGELAAPYETSAGQLTSAFQRPPSRACACVPAGRGAAAAGRRADRAAGQQQGHPLSGGRGDWLPAAVGLRWADVQASTCRPRKQGRMP